MPGCTADVFPFFITASQNRGLPGGGPPSISHCLIQTLCTPNSPLTVDSHHFTDVTEEAAKYDGKTVRFKGQVALLRRTKENMFAPGRFVMTCCEEDIQFCGIPCSYSEASKLEPRSWVMVTAKIKAEKHPLYKGETGPVLYAQKVEAGVPAASPDIATF